MRALAESLRATLDFPPSLTPNSKAAGSLPPRILDCTLPTMSRNSTLAHVPVTSHLERCGTPPPRLISLLPPSPAASYDPFTSDLSFIRRYLIRTPWGPSASLEMECEVLTQASLSPAPLLSTTVPAMPPFSLLECPKRSPTSELSLPLSGTALLRWLHGSLPCFLQFSRRLWATLSERTSEWPYLQKFIHMPSLFPSPALLLFRALTTNDTILFMCVVSVRPL